MSKGAKILLALLIVILLVCICACAGAYIFQQRGGFDMLTNPMVNDEQTAQDVGEKMFQYSVPAGYTEDSSMDMGIMSIVMLTPSTNDPIIMLVRLPGLLAMDPSTFQDQMQQQMQEQFGNGSTMEVVGTGTVTVRGEEVNLTYFEGTSTENQFVLRMMVSDFIKGDNGQVMVMAMGEKTSWNQTLVENFLKSIQ
jgi:hypothetical protein